MPRTPGSQRVAQTADSKVPSRAATKMVGRSAHLRRRPSKTAPEMAKTGVVTRVRPSGWEVHRRCSKVREYSLERDEFPHSHHGVRHPSLVVRPPASE